MKTKTIEKLLKEKNKGVKRGRPTVNAREITKSSQEGTKLNETRATFIVNEVILEKLKDMAYWERLKIKEVIAAALEDAVSKYETEKGAIKPRVNF